MESVLRKFDPQEVKTLAQLSAHYAVEADEDPARMFMRFNLSGCDYKGQISSGFGTRGFSFEFKAGIDLGSAFADRFKLEAMAGGKATRTYMTMMVCCRMPTEMYDHALSASMLPNAPAVRVSAAGAGAAATSPLPVSTKPLPLWRGSRPLTLAVLTGVAWQGQLGANATAAMGQVDLGEVDEVRSGGKTTGVGAEISVRGTGRCIDLVDTSARAFGGSPSEGGLAAAVESELIGDIKVQVVAWLKEQKGESVADLVDRTTRQEGKKYFGLADDDKGDDEDEEDEADEDDEDDDGKDDDAHAALLGVAKPLAKKSWKLLSAFKGRRPGTTKLLNKLQKVAMTSGPADDEQAREIQAKVIEYSARLLALKKRKDSAKGSPKSSRTAPVPDPASAARPPPRTLVPSRFALRSATLTADAGAKGGVDASLLGRKLSASANADLNYAGKRVRSLFQVAGESAGGLTLVMSQETLLTHSVFSLGAGGSLGDKKGALEKAYGTITYRTVTVYWLARTAGQTPSALPNGSGLSFGLSIAADRLSNYAKWCRAQRNAATAADEDVTKTENFLTGQLRVESKVLRDFFADYLFGNAELEPAVLVESAFDFYPGAEAALPALTLNERKECPQELFEYAPAKARLAEPTAKAVSGTALQALRVRCPLGTDTDEGRSIFALGVVFLKTQARRVARVGSHGAFDLHVRFYPNPYDKAKDKAAAETRQADDAKRQQELAVPPVALFGEIE